MTLHNEAVKIQGIVQYCFFFAKLHKYTHTTLQIISKSSSVLYSDSLTYQPLTDVFDEILLLNYQIIYL